MYIASWTVLDPFSDFTAFLKTCTLRGTMLISSCSCHGSWFSFVINWKMGGTSKVCALCLRSQDTRPLAGLGSRVDRAYVWWSQFDACLICHRSPNLRPIFPETRQACPKFLDNSLQPGTKIDIISPGCIQLIIVRGLCFFVPVHLKFSRDSFSSYCTAAKVPVTDLSSSLLSLNGGFLLGPDGWSLP